MKKFASGSEKNRINDGDYHKELTQNEKLQDYKAINPGKSIETMFRITSSNSIHISEMADKKANIMISVNSIILSVILGLSVRHLDENRITFIPTITLLAVNVSTIIYSILATMPKSTKGVFTKEQLENKSLNILFFGNFHKMDFNDYKQGMRKMMNDKEFLYDSLLIDLYMQGRVLARKYRYLQVAYRIFMYGLIVSVIAYAITGFIQTG